MSVKCSCGSVAQLSIRGNCLICGEHNSEPSNPNPQPQQVATRKPRSKVDRKFTKRK